MKFPMWSRRFVEATRKSGLMKPEVAIALKEHVARTEARVERIARLSKAGMASQSDLLNAQYKALEAKRWLQEEWG